jgi:hypothetical protein
LTAADWRKVLFSDEHHFAAQGLRVTHVRSDAESVSSKHMQLTIRHPLKDILGLVFILWHSMSSAQKHISLSRCNGAANDMCRFFDIFSKNIVSFEDTFSV